MKHRNSTYVAMAAVFNPEERQFALKVTKSKLLLLFTILLAFIFTALAHAQPVSNILNGVQRWEEGAHWNSDGSINDLPNAPLARGIIRCGSSAETQSQVSPVNGYTYNPGQFLVDISNCNTIDPSSGNAVNAVNPTPGQPMIWLNFDVRPFAGSFQVQINDNAGDNIAWALYSSSAHQSGVTHIPAANDSLSGTSGTLSLIACGVESSNTWNTLPISSENFTKAINLYMAIWDQNGIDNEVTVNNFKARFGCGDADDYVICALTNDAPIVSCVDDDFYEVSVTIYGSNGLYEVVDQTNSAVDISEPVCLSNLGDGGSVSETISLVYPIGVDYNFDIKAVDNPQDCADPENVSECQILGITGSSLTKPSAVTTATQILCNGGFGIGDVAVSGGVEPYSFLWSNGAETQQIGNLNPGTYSVIVTDANGCTDEASILIEDEPQPITNNIQETICQGSSFLFDGNELTDEGQYQATFTSAAGCDSIVNLDLVVTPTITNNIQETICQGSSFLFDGNELTDEGQYQATFTSASGCDSIVNLDLVVTPTITNNIQETICEGSSYLFDGNELTDEGQYQATFISAAGCDSIVNLDLVVTPTITNNIQETICQGASFLFDGNELTDEGQYQATFTSAAGCDSIVNLDLVVTPTITNNIQETICEGASFLFDGNELTDEGQYLATFTSAAGCDSIVNLDLVVTPTITNNIQETICEGASFLFDGNELTDEGQYQATFTSASGCDSIVNLDLVVTPTITNNIQETICQGSSFLFDGNELTDEGQYQATFTSAAGCDSIVNLDLVVKPTITNNIQETICQGASFLFDGNELTDEGQYQATFTSAAGCDSIVNLDLVVTPTITNNIQETICQGASFLFDGNELTDEGQYQATFTSTAGCDSIVNLELSVTSLEIQKQVTDVSCETGFGGITITLTGGAEPYQYLWTTTDGDGIADGQQNQATLSPGTYTLEVYDSNNCMATEQITLTEPICQKPICVKVVSCQIKCYDDKGSLKATATGGTAPYTFLWSNGETSQSIYQLQPGEYEVTVTDSNGKSSKGKGVIQNAPEQIKVNETITEVDCQSKVGGISIEVEGGVADYTFKWSTTNGSGIEEGLKDQNQLTAGTYVVTVVDANGCTVKKCIVLPEPVCKSYVCLVMEPKQIACSNDLGSIHTKVSGGKAPYTYLWSTGETTPEISELTPGTYTCTVTDALGSSDVRKATIYEAPTPIKVYATATPAIGDENNGSIELEVKGGTQPYSYLWCTGETTKDIESLQPMVYFVDITDANGCTFRKYQLVERCVTTDITETLAWQKAKAYAYPNPFKSLIHIEISSEKNTSGQVQIYDTKGALLAIPFKGELKAREMYLVEYDGASLPAGSILIYKLITNEKVVTGKLIKR